MMMNPEMASVSRSTVDLCLTKIAELIKTNHVRSDGLLNGGLGGAIYLLYLSNYYNDSNYQSFGKKRLEEILHRAFSGSSNLLRKNSLLNGAVGLAWTIHVLTEEGFVDKTCARILPGLDKIIFERIPEQVRNNDLDFIHSSVGAIAYLADRGRENHDVNGYLEILAEELEKKMNVFNCKGAFIKNQYFLKKTGIGDENDVNIRLAHGYCGLLLVLIKLYKLGIAQASVRNILEQGISFILSTLKVENFDDTKEYIFPSNYRISLPEDHPTNLGFYKIRTGWCYGDLNQVFLLYQAGHLLNRQDWIDIADKVGSFTLLKRNFEETMIHDTCLCHGTSGVGRFFWALHQVSGNNKYLEGYEFWMQKTARMVEEIFENNTFPEKPCSYLEGLAGSGMALMDYSSGRYSKWDKFLLLQ